MSLLNLSSEHIMIYTVISKTDLNDHLDTLAHSARNKTYPTVTVEKFAGIIEALNNKPVINLDIDDNHFTLTNLLQKLCNEVMDITNHAFSTNQVIIAHDKGEDTEFDPFQMDSELDEMIEEFDEKIKTVITGINSMPQTCNTINRFIAESLAETATGDTILNDNDESIELNIAPCDIDIDEVKSYLMHRYHNDELEANQDIERYFGELDMELKTAMNFSWFSKDL